MKTNPESEGKNVNFFEPVQRFLRRHVAYFDLVVKVLKDKDVNANGIKILRNGQGIKEKIRRVNAEVMDKGNEVFWSDSNLRLRGFRPEGTSNTSARRRKRGKRHNRAKG